MAAAATPSPLPVSAHNRSRHGCRPRRRALPGRGPPGRTTRPACPAGRGRDDRAIARTTPLASLAPALRKAIQTGTRSGELTPSRRRLLERPSPRREDARGGSGTLMLWQSAWEIRCTHPPAPPESGRQDREPADRDPALAVRSGPRVRTGMGPGHLVARSGSGRGAGPSPGLAGQPIPSCRLPHHGCAGPIRVDGPVATTATLASGLLSRGPLPECVAPHASGPATR